MGVYIKTGENLDRPDFCRLAFVYMRLALTVRLNYETIMADNSMGFNGIRPGPNI